MSERTGIYWICDECAEKRGLVCDSIGNTVIAGLCGHCDNPDEVTLTPIRDFKKPAIKKNLNE